jgi:signal transduction histidine kinase
VIVVLVEGDEGRLDAFVRDDGRGMPERAPADRPGHLGMVGMRERALAIGARLRIESLAGTGTTVQLHWGDTDESPVPDR